MGEFRNNLMNNLCDCGKSKKVVSGRDVAVMCGEAAENSRESLIEQPVPASKPSKLETSGS